MKLPDRSGFVGLFLAGLVIGASAVGLLLLGK